MPRESGGDPAPAASKGNLTSMAGPSSKLSIPQKSGFFFNLAEDFSQGFCISLKGKTKHTSLKNLKSVVDIEEVVWVGFIRRYFW